MNAPLALHQPCPYRAAYRSDPTPETTRDQQTGGQPGAVIDAEAVFRDHAGRVFGVARRILGNDADAEDVTQEVLVQVLRKAATFRGESSVSTWLYRVTVNAALALRRKRATWRERPIGDPIDRVFDDRSKPTRAGGSARPDHTALGNEMRSRIEAAIRDLPVLYRAPYVLADVEGLANAEIAEILKLSLAAVKSRLHRARTLMRDALAPYVQAP